MDSPLRILESKFCKREECVSYLLFISEYLEAGVPYVTMRMFCALNGVLVVPIAYWTVRGCGHSIAAAVVAALMVCYGKKRKGSSQDKANGTMDRKWTYCQQSAHLARSSVVILYLDNGLDVGELWEPRAKVRKKRRICV